jgi:hypothetical protein
MIIPHEVTKKPIEYVVLVIILLTALVAFLASIGNGPQEKQIVYIAAGAYFLWSLVHHYRRGDLSTSIMIEYFLIAIFGIIVVSSTVF